MSGLTDEFGLVDSSIDDINPEPGPFDPAGAPRNYCERRGRCIVAVSYTHLTLPTKA